MGHKPPKNGWETDFLSGPKKTSNFNFPKLSWHLPGGLFQKVQQKPNWIWDSQPKKMAQHLKDHFLLQSNWLRVSRLYPARSLEHFFEWLPSLKLTASLPLGHCCSGNMYRFVFVCVYVNIYIYSYCTHSNIIHVSILRVYIYTHICKISPPNQWSTAIGNACYLLLTFDQKLLSFIIYIQTHLCLQMSKYL